LEQKHVTSWRVTVGLVLLLALGSLGVSGAIWLAAPAGYDETVLRFAWETHRGRSGDDSWNPSAKALAHIRSNAPEPLYTEIFFEKGIRYQYPPSALFALAAMQWIAPSRVIIDDEIYTGPRLAINDIIGWIFVLLTVCSTAALIEIGLRSRGIPMGGAAMLALRFCVVTALTLTFYPVVKAYTLGQIQTWVNGAFALSLLCWVTGRKWSSGALIGFACLVKPHYGLLLLWAALRREWRFVYAAGIVLAVGLTASVSVFGWENHIDYLRVLSFLSERGESYYPNQSVNGLLNRLMSVTDPQEYNNVFWRDGHFPPFTPLVYLGTSLSSILILGAALVRRRRENDPGRVLDFCTMVLSVTIASPIAWEHHYGVLLPIFAVLLASVIGDRSRTAWLALCYVLAANFFLATNLLAPTVFNVMQSYLFASALGILVLLHMRRRTGVPWQAVAAAV
jgi:alpha-1,2-mannosyltransferase